MAILINLTLVMLSKLNQKPCSTNNNLIQTNILKNNTNPLIWKTVGTISNNLKKWMKPQKVVEPAQLIPVLMAAFTQG